MGDTGVWHVHVGFCFASCRCTVKIWYKNPSPLWARKLINSDSHWCQIAHVDMLIVNICMVGIFEVHMSESNPEVLL
jgi:hypothetical protein